MTRRDLEAMTTEELIREIEKLRAAERRTTASLDERDPRRLIHELHAHQIELEMQNRELRTAQELLEESRSRYVDLYDFAPVGYCTLDPTGEIREINLRGAALLEAPREELIGRAFSRLGSLRDPKAFRAHMRRCAERKDEVTGEVSLSSGKAGGVRVVQIVTEPERDASRVVTAYRMILVDITATKQLEGKLRLLAEAGAALASSLDAETTLMTTARLAVPTLADLCMIDVVDEAGHVERPVVLFADARKQQTLAESMKRVAPRSGWHTPQSQVIAAGEPMLIADVPVRPIVPSASDDSRVDAPRAADIRSLMVVPLRARGRTRGALTLAAVGSERRFSTSDLRTAEDLASRVALALENARLYTEVRRAVAARDATLAVVSHDLRNALSVILMKTDAMRRAPTESDRSARGKALDVIRRAADQMNRLIRDLLDVSSIEAGQFSVDPCRQPVVSLVNEALDAWQAQAATKSLRLSGEFPAGDRFDVRCDRGRVEQALGNLIGNAIKFTGPGGAITVRVEPGACDVCFTIADTGPGIAAPDLAHVFDRFWQAEKTAHMGAGLGLAITRGIVEAHGGRIWVESQVGAGTSFCFTLPLAGPPGPVILLADDDPDMRVAIGDILEHAGYCVVSVANGAEALKYLHRAPPPAAIVLDLQMPVMDGWTFLAHRAREPALYAIPVVVVSGQPGVADRVTAAHASHLEKPVDADELLATLRRLVA